MSVLLSFWKPVSIFESRFNKWAAWLTNGDYCHSDIVLCVEPEMLKSSITKSMALNNPQLNTSIEQCFFNDASARQQLSGDNLMYVSFSALWGMDLSARVLRSTATNAWEHIPIENHSDVDWVEVIGTQDIQSICDFCVAQMGKKYASFNAVLSASGSECNWFYHPEKSKFCSELCVSALQIDNILSDLKPAAITPNALYKHVIQWNESNA